MALILVRGENNSKLLNAISDMERHGNLNLITTPKVIDAGFADSLVESILNSKRATDIVNGFKCGKASEDLCKRCGYAQRFTNK